MLHKFCPLASGSKGNAIYVRFDQTKLLIDAGLSFRALGERLGAIDVDLGEINAILVTHEHGDHIRGIEGITKKLKIPVFANSETARSILNDITERPKFKIFSTGESFEYENIKILPFSVQHDTLDPVAFILKAENIKIGICTDLGFVTSLTKTHLKRCDYLYVEANHEPSMVHASARPTMHKQRVLGRQGHLSNDACAHLLQEIEHPDLKHVYLAHLSAECNHPDLALERIRTRTKRQLSISIAHQNRVSQILEGQ